MNLGKLIADEAFELTDFHGLNQLTFYDKSSSVYAKNDTSKVENLNDLVYYAPDYLSGHQTHDSKTRLNLYQMPDLKLVISGDFQKYEFHNGLIFGFKDTTQARNEISLFDANGTLLQPTLQFERLLADGRMVLKKTVCIISAINLDNHSVNIIRLLAMKPVAYEQYITNLLTAISTIKHIKK